MENYIVKEFQELCDKFIQYLTYEKKSSSHTVASYKLDMGALMYYVEQNYKRIAHPDIPTLISSYVSFLNESALSKASIARKTSCLSTFSRFLGHEGITLNIALKRPYFVEKKPVFLGCTQLSNLFDESEKYAKKPRFYIRERAIWELLLSTGIRCSEVILIALEDLILEEKKVFIKDTKNQSRLLSFNEKTYMWITKYLREERPLYDPQEPFLFLNNCGAQLKRRAIQRSLKLLAKLVDFHDEITPHMVRHSYAMNLLKQGVSEEAMKQILGLKSSESIEKYIVCSKV